MGRETSQIKMISKGTQYELYFRKDAEGKRTEKTYEEMESGEIVLTHNDKDPSVFLVGGLNAGDNRQTFLSLGKGGFLKGKAFELYVKVAEKEGINVDVEKERLATAAMLRSGKVDWNSKITQDERDFRKGKKRKISVED